MTITDSPNAAEQCPDPRGTTSRVKQTLIFVSMFLGCFIGDTVGKEIGKKYSGFGHVSGTRIGEWLGFSLGFAVFMIIAVLLTTENSGSKIRDVLAYSVIGIAFVLCSVIAVIAEGTAGEPGGIIAFTGSGIVIGSLAYFIGRRRHITNR